MGEQETQTPGQRRTAAARAAKHRKAQERKAVSLAQEGWLPIPPEMVDDSLIEWFEAASKLHEND